MVKTGIIVAGNEYNKVDTIKVLATAIRKDGTLMGEVIGNGMYNNAEALANSPAYVEAVETMALYLAKIGINPTEDAEDEDEDAEDEDELEDDEDEDEDEDEEPTYTCDRCGGECDEDEVYCVGEENVCLDCISGREYAEIMGE